MAYACIGTSGWNYKHWANDVFYPKRLATSKWLAYYFSHFDTVEVNNTFYRLPEKHVFEKWYDLTPAGFTFAVKASRFFTHIKRLKDPEEHAALFLERAVGLRDKLAVILFQLPPTLRADLDRLECFLAYMKKQKIMPGVRVAVEFREASWLAQPVYDVLKHYNASLVIADYQKLPILGPVTADFVFVRRHGSSEVRYSGSYSEDQLCHDASLLKGWVKDGRDAYIYFNNDVGGHAITNANRLKELMRQLKNKAA